MFTPEQIAAAQTAFSSRLTHLWDQRGASATYVIDSPADAIAALGAALKSLFGKLVDGFEAFDQFELSESHEERFVRCKGYAIPLPDARVVPLPSWCAWLHQARILRISEAAPRVEDEPGGRRLAQTFFLVGRNEEKYAFTAAATLLEVDAKFFLAMSPDHLAAHWKGPVMFRAATEAGEVRLSMPAIPGGTVSASEWDRVSTLAVERRSPSDRPALPSFFGKVKSAVVAREDRDPPKPYYPVALGKGWPEGWPSFVELEFRRGRDAEPEARALLHARTLWQDSSALTKEVGTTAEGKADVAYELSLDIGTTTTCIVTEKRAGSTELTQPFDLGLGRGESIPSGWRTLAGDRGRAWMHGCGELLEPRLGLLPTEMVFPSARAVEIFFADPSADAALGWLRQQAQPNQGRPFAAEPDYVVVSCFKDPRFLGEKLPDGQELGRKLSSVERSEKYLAGYMRSLGWAVANAHLTPRPAETGRWMWPRLTSLEVVLTHPRRAAWDAAAVGRPTYAERLRAFAEEHFAAALGFAWSEVIITGLVAEHEAARAAGADASEYAVSEPIDEHVSSESTTVAMPVADLGRPQVAAEMEESLPITVYADLGGASFQISVDVEADGDLVPLRRSSIMEYDVGGEAFLSAAGFAMCAPDATTKLQSGARGHEARYLKIRELIHRSKHLPAHHPLAEALRVVFARRAARLIARQVDATLIAADAPNNHFPSRGGPVDHGRYTHLPIRVILFGQGWLLAKLDSPNLPHERQYWAGQFLSQELARELGHEVRLVILPKRALCRGALRLGRDGERQTARPEARDSILGADVQRPEGVLRFWCSPDGRGGWATLQDRWWEEFTAGCVYHARARWHLPEVACDTLEKEPIGMYHSEVAPLLQFWDDYGPSCLARDMAPLLGGKNFP